jgi:hypothetical protein
LAKRRVSAYAGIQAFLLITRRSFKMKKKVLMSLVLLAIIGTSAVFAQQPTLDKLTFFNNTAQVCEARAANKQISGAVVIPATAPSGRTVAGVNSFEDCKGVTSVVFPDSGNITIGTSAFWNCTGITSITIPTSVRTIQSGAFAGCANLTSVTFKGEPGWSQGQTGIQNNDDVFPGDLRAKYVAGGAGTYTRSAGGTVWTKQGTAAAPNTSLDGVWRHRNTGLILISFSGNTAVFSDLARDISSVAPIWQDAKNKGYIKVGDQYIRNIRSTGNLTWSVQFLQVWWGNNNRDVATHTQWADGTLTMSPDGSTFDINGANIFIRAGIQ